ncbi:hypothetical protein T07_10633 [Trichinella nelsoni]|uniref:Uncharacterized protein n=1 Tax=Trichinella nelsoni TaxID=6336 RepID=A0A0V0SHE0_9BILA|nr:hypothetical protein T07_10633 [Trichinella nelsoni]
MAFLCGAQTAGSHDWLSRWDASSSLIAEYDFVVVFLVLLATSSLTIVDFVQWAHHYPCPLWVDQMDLDASQSNHHLEESIQLLHLRHRLDSEEDLSTLPLS